MGIRVAEGYVEISADTDRLDRDVAGIGGRSSGSLMSSGLKLGGALVGGLLAVDLAGKAKDWIGGAIMAGSDLNETISKSTAIFGPQQAAISAWASTSATSIGLSTSAAMSAASGFGDMFTQIGFTGDEAAKMSTSVVQAAADLGSFSNLETADVSDRISAAFRGEYDSLQAVIPNINAARVEQEAMAATGKTNAAALTAQEKATAVMAIVTKDGVRAMGDFGKTSGGFANQMKIASAQSEDLKGKIGGALQPALQGAAGVLTGSLMPALLGMADRAGPAIESTIAGFSGLKAVLFDGDFQGADSLFGFQEDSGFVDFLFTARETAVSVFGAIGTAVSNFASGFAPYLAPVMGVLSNLVPTLLSVAASVSPFQIVLTALAPLAGTLGATFGQFASILAGNLLTTLLTLQPTISGLSIVLSNGLATVLPMIIGLLPTVATLFGSLSMAASSILSALLPLATSIIGMLLPALTSIISAVLPVASSLVGLVSTAIVPLVTTIVGVLVPVITALLPVITTVFGVIVSIVTAAMGIVKGVIQVATGIITGNWSMVWSGIVNIFSGIWNTIKAVVSGAIGIVKSVIVAGINLVKAQWSSAWSAIGGVVGSVASGIAGAVGSLVSTVQSKIAAVVGFFSGLKSDILGALGSIAGGMRDSGAKIMQGLIDGILGTIGRVKDAVGDVMSAARNLLPFSPAKEGPFSGKGWTLYSGMSIGGALADGMRSQISGVRSAAFDMVNAAVPRGITAPTMVGGSAGGSAPTQVTLNQEIKTDDPVLYARKTAREIARYL